MGLSPKKRRAIAAYADGGAVWPLVDPGWLRSPLTLTRAQLAGVQSSATGADGATLNLFGADVARFQGTARRLLIEGQRTNAIRNPRAEGAVAGTPGTLPTNWVAQSPTLGLQRQVVGVGTEDGIPYIEIRVFGTTTNANASWRFDFEPTNFVAAAQGQVWTSSAFVRLVAGAFPSGVAAALFVQEFTAGNVQVQQSSSSFSTATGASLAAQRFRHTRTLTDATTAFVAITVFFNVPTPGTVVDFTLRIGAPQLEQAAFASTPILPPVGTPGASTRGADIVQAPLASLGIGGNGACTVLWSGMIPQAAPSSAHQAIAQIDDGTNNNRLTLRNVQGTANVGVIWVVSGVGAGTATAGALTAGTPFRVGVSLNGAGRAAASLNGGAAAIVTGGISGGLTTLRLGQQIGGAEMFGETTLLRVLPYTLSDTDLAAAVAALPT